MATLLTADCQDEKYLPDQLKHFFNTVSYPVVCAFTKTEKDRYFKMVTEHEHVLAKLLGEGFTQSLICLPVAHRNGVDNALVGEYKIWLRKYA